MKCIMTRSLLGISIVLATAEYAQSSTPSDLEVQSIECKQTDATFNEYVLLSRTDLNGSFLYVTGTTKTGSMIASELAYKLGIDWSADSFSIETPESPECTLDNSAVAVGVYRFNCSIPEGSKLVVRVSPSRSVRQDITGGQYSLYYSPYYQLPVEFGLVLKTVDHPGIAIKSTLENSFCKADETQK